MGFVALLDFGDTSSGDDRWMILGGVDGLDIGAGVGFGFGFVTGASRKAAGFTSGFSFGTEWFILTAGKLDD
jgi:hypothetical protein